MLLAEISANYRLSSTRVFGIGWGMVTLGVLLGAVAGDAVDRFAPFSPQFLSFIALVATMAVLLSFLFVFRESDLIALTEEPEDPSSENFSGTVTQVDRASSKECCRRATSTKIVNAASNAAPALPGPLPGSGRRLRAVAQGDRGDDPLRQGPLGRPHSRGAVYLEGDREHPFAPHLPEDGRPFQTGNARRHRRRHEGVGPHPVGVLPASMDFPTFSLVGLRILWQKAVSGCGLEAKPAAQYGFLPGRLMTQGNFPLDGFDGPRLLCAVGIPPEFSDGQCLQSRTSGARFISRCVREGRLQAFVQRADDMKDTSSFLDLALDDSMGFRPPRRLRRRCRRRC